MLISELPDKFQVLGLITTEIAPKNDKISWLCLENVTSKYLHDQS